MRLLVAGAGVRSRPQTARVRAVADAAAAAASRTGPAEAMRQVDVTVVGGGPVGLFASFYAGMRGMSVRIIDSLPELGGQLIALYPEKYVYDMPGFHKVLAKDLAHEMIKQGLEFGAEVQLEQTATELIKDDEGYVIRTHTGLALPTRTVVISAGAGAFTPAKIGVEREAEFVGKGLHYGVREKA